MGQVFAQFEPDVYFAVEKAMTHLHSFTDSSSNSDQHWAHLAAQAHGLYVRLCDRQADGADVPMPVVQRAYRRYRRRVARHYQSRHIQ